MPLYGFQCEHGTLCLSHENRPLEQVKRGYWSTFSGFMWTYSTYRFWSFNENLGATELELIDLAVCF